MVTNRALQWQRQTEVIQLPSGLEAEVQRPNATSMILESGDVPEFLAQRVLTQMFSPDQNGAAPGIVRVGTKDLASIGKLINQVVIASLVSPRIVDGDPDYAKDEISLADVRDTDKSFIFQWAMNGHGEGTEVRNLQSFPGRPAESVDPRSDVRALDNDASGSA